MKDYTINFRDACSKCTVPPKPEPKPTPTPPASHCEVRKIVKIVSANGKVFVVYDDCTFTTADPSVVDFKSLLPKVDNKELEKQIKELQETLTKQSNELKEVKESCKYGSHESPEDLITIYTAGGKPSFKAHKLPNELPSNPVEPKPKTPPDLPAPPAEKPKNEKTKVEIEFFLDGGSIYKIELEGKPGTKIPREQFNAKMKELESQNKELMTTTFEEDAVFYDINYLQYYLVKFRTPKMSKVIFKRVDLPPEGWNLDTHATILGELTGKVGSEIPTTIYDEHAKSSRYLKFVSSDFTPPMYFPDSETPTVFTITMQRLPIQAEDGAADAHFKFIEQDTNKILKEFSVHGTVGFKIPTTKYDEALTELQNQGYELVSTTFDSTKRFQGITREDTFETIMREHVVPFDPNKPVRPNPMAPDGYPNDPMEPRV